MVKWTWNGGRVGDLDSKWSLYHRSYYQTWDRSMRGLVGVKEGLVRG